MTDKTLTNQEIFDRAAKHCLAQGHRAMKSSPDSDYCAYLTEDGDRCSVGCFLKQDKETDFKAKRLEGVWDDIREMLIPLLDFQIAESQFNLMAALQNAHDSAQQDFNGYNGARSFDNGFRIKMQTVAATFLLDDSVVKK